jgi:hypothetical protein
MPSPIIEEYIRRCRAAAAELEQRTEPLTPDELAALARGVLAAMEADGVFDQ